MMLNWACFCFALCKAFIQPGAWTQGPPVTACLALLLFSGAHWGGVEVIFERHWLTFSKASL